MVRTENPTEDEINRSDPWFHFFPLFELNDIVVVSPVGNDGSLTDSDSEFASPKRYAQPGRIAENTLIVVGGMTEKNRRWNMSNLWPSVITTYAPATDIQSAAFNSGTNYFISDGTSEAAAMTAGIIATYLARDDLANRLQIPGSVAANVKLYLRVAARYGSDSDPDDGIVDHTVSMNYVRCTDIATFNKRSESNNSIVFRDDGPIDPQSFSSTPIRRPGMLRTTPAGVSLSICIPPAIPSPYLIDIFRTFADLQFTALGSVSWF